MPTYQYACTSCGERLEVVQKFSDDPLTVCPACSGALRKVFSPVGVVFKGSGFYKTDSRSAKRGAGSSGAPSGPADDKTGKPAGDKDTAPSGSGADAAPTTSGTDSSASAPTPSGDGKAGSSERVA